MDVIHERLSVHDARHRIYIEWQTKILAGFIASTVQSEKGARELQRVASGLSMMQHSSRTQSAHPEPRVGSYEKLTGLFGASRSPQ